VNECNHRERAHVTNECDHRERAHVTNECDHRERAHVTQHCVQGWSECNAYPKWHRRVCDEGGMSDVACGNECVHITPAGIGVVFSSCKLSAFYV
jgi:hypothetical protein